MADCSHRKHKKNQTALGTLAEIGTRCLFINPAPVVGISTRIPDIGVVEVGLREHCIVFQVKTERGIQIQRFLVKL